MKRWTARATLIGLTTLLTACETPQLPTDITLHHKVELRVYDRACPPSPGPKAKAELKAIPWASYPFALGWLEALRAHRDDFGCNS